MSCRAPEGAQQLALLPGSIAGTANTAMTQQLALVPASSSGNTAQIAEELAATANPPALGGVSQPSRVADQPAANPANGVGSSVNATGQLGVSEDGHGDATRELEGQDAVLALPAPQRLVSTVCLTYMACKGSQLWV